MALPEFLVAGVPKAGTTALHAALSRHPDLYMSPIKEPKFFLTDGPPPAKGGGPGDALTYREHIWQRDRYEALFDAAPPGALCGESTPLYLYNRPAMRRIRTMIPEAKLIVILRDPVERAHSNWTHLWSAGLEPVGDFVRACAEEERRVAAGWASFWHYTGLGKYGQQLDYAFSLFPREQILVLRYGRLVNSPADALDRIWSFLGVEPGIVTEVPRENVTTHPEQTLRHRAVSRGMRAVNALGRLVPDDRVAQATHRVERFLQRGGRERQPLSWEQRQALLPVFEDDIKLLEKVLGEDFGHWLAPRERSGGLVGARPNGQGQAKNGRPRLAPHGGQTVITRWSAEFGDQRVRTVLLGHLVVQPGLAVGQVHEVQIAQRAATVGGEGGRAAARRRGRDQRRGVVACRDAGTLLEVLREAGPPIVEGRERLSAEPDGGDPGATGVPLAGPAG